jgi:hypothetical protein
MKKFAALFGIAALSLSTVGCMIYPAGHSVSSVPIEDMEKVDIIGEAEGAATTVYFLLWFPIGSVNPTRDAINDAKTKMNADALIDITVDDHWLWFFVFNFQRKKVHATAVQIED